MARPDILIRRSVPQEIAQRQASPARPESSASPVLKVGALTLGEFRPGPPKTLDIQPLNVTSSAPATDIAAQKTFADGCTVAGASCNDDCILAADRSAKVSGKLGIEVFKIDSIQTTPKAKKETSGQTTYGLNKCC